MSSLRRALAAVAVLASLAVLAQPSPPPARANLACDAVGGIGGGIGLGNPVGDACNTISGAIGGIPDPIGGALKGLGNDVFAQITTWVSEGASWLIGRVVSAIERTTTPKLTGKGFLATYAKMAAIASLLGAAMLLLAVLEGLAQGNAALLLRAALLHLPLAFIATSVAYLVVQLLLGATDGLSEAIASASGHDATRFFEAAIGGLGKAGAAAGGATGHGAAARAGGALAVPLFVTFLAAIVGALAAFFVWIELLMRDAAVYVVALFLPLALAASIWPRWTGALRRTAELLVALIASKFAIVAVVSLAASLLADPGGRVEHLLAAAALMLLACFAPFVLLKLMPFAEGALGAAYGRRSAAGGAIGAVQLASDVQILRNMARSRFTDDSGVALWSASDSPDDPPGRLGAKPRGGPDGGAGEGGGASAKPGKGDGPGRGGAKAAGSPAGTKTGAGAPVGGGGGGTAGGGAAAGAGAASPAAAAAAVPVAAARGARGAAGRLSESGVAEAAGSAPRPQDSQPAQDSQARESPSQEKSSGSAASGPEPPPRPAPDKPGAKAEKGNEK
jgi:hypothetical protein